jgi:hypothetical protein
MEVSGRFHALGALSQDKIAVLVDNRQNIYASVLQKLKIEMADVFIK